MRIKMTASHEELSIPAGHPLHGSHARLLVWDYSMDGREHDGKPSGAHFTATPSAVSPNPNALNMYEKDIHSLSVVQAIADALDSLDGNALWEAIQPLMSPTEVVPTEVAPTQKQTTEEPAKPARKKAASKKASKEAPKEEKAESSPAPDPAKTRGRPRKAKNSVKDSHADE